MYTSSTYIDTSDEQMRCTPCAYLDKSDEGLFHPASCVVLDLGVYRQFLSRDVAFARPHVQHARDGSRRAAQTTQLLLITASGFALSSKRKCGGGGREGGIQACLPCRTRDLQSDDIFHVLYALYELSRTAVIAVEKLQKIK